MWLRRIVHRFAPALVGSWLLAWGAGCGARDGGQTGDGSPARPSAGGSSEPVSAPEAGNDCREERRLVADASELGELGFSAQQAASVFERQERHRLVWNQDLSSAPADELEASELVLTLSAAGKAASWVSPGPSGEALAGCGPYLELPVVVEVRSSRGALDERVVAKLAVRSLEEASLEQALEVTQLAGTWRTSLQDASATRVELRVALSGAGSRGQLLVHELSESELDPSTPSRAQSAIAAEWAESLEW